MLSRLTIRNFKSIREHTLELGRINVFIGENGCGKTNLLEALALAGAALADKLTVEDLFNRGVRVARPAGMRSAFTDDTGEKIAIECEFLAESGGELRRHAVGLTPRQSRDGELEWIASHPLPGRADADLEQLRRDLTEDRTRDLLDRVANAVGLTSGEIEELVRQFVEVAERPRRELAELLDDFAVYNASPLALRGLHVFSRRSPVGIHGESLDVAISALPPEVWEDLLERARCVSWLDDIKVDPDDRLKYAGHKLGRSVSTLYFHDRFVHPQNNVFSAENVNEGVLHVLFHLLLCVSAGTPRVLGIDNIDTALNPQLCRELVKQLVELSAHHHKQVLLTTHNPAILDGLNLHDDEQRLFVVYRDDDGHTITRRITSKPRPEGQALKLSELWMRGHLGGIPRNF